MSEKPYHKPPEDNERGPQQAKAEERQTERQAPNDESPGVPASSDQS